MKFNVERKYNTATDWKNEGECDVRIYTGEEGFECDIWSNKNGEIKLIHLTEVKTYINMDFLMIVGFYDLESDYGPSRYELWYVKCSNIT